MTKPSSPRDVDQMRRNLFRRSADPDVLAEEQGLGHPIRELDGTTRPVSAEWRLKDRTAAFQTAVANVAYIWRDSDRTDRLGPVPAWFAQRRDDLVAFGQIAPKSAPSWVTGNPFRVWAEADTATHATGEPTAVAAWHTLLELPIDIDQAAWEQLVTIFVERHLVRRGAVVAYAVHALRDDLGGWSVKPHVHLIVTARRWRTGRGQGERMSRWLGSWTTQERLARRWRGWCGLARVRDVRRSEQVGRAVPWMLGNHDLRHTMATIIKG